MPGFTASQAKTRALTAIAVSNVSAESQLLAKYQPLFTAIENNAADKKFEIVVGFTPAAYGEMAKILNVYGYKVTQTTSTVATISIGADSLPPAVFKGGKATPSVLNIPAGQKIDYYTVSWGTAPTTIYYTVGEGVG